MKRRRAVWFSTLLACCSSTLNNNQHLSRLLETAVTVEEATTIPTNFADASCNNDPTSIVVVKDHNENITVYGLADRTDYHHDALWTRRLNSSSSSNPSCHAHESQRIPVVVFPFCTENNNWEGLRMDSTFFHLFADGLDQSLVLYRVDQDNATTIRYNLHPNVEWMVAMKERQFSRRVCGQVTQHIQRAQGIRKTLGLPTKWPVIFAQFTDGSAPHRCVQAEQLMDNDDGDATSSKFVTYVRRSVVTGRRIVNGSLIELGTINLQFTRHSPIPVRSDTVASVQRVLRTVYNQELWDPIEQSFVRSIDVAHFWPPHPRK